MTAGENKLEELDRPPATLEWTSDEGWAIPVAEEERGGFAVWKCGSGPHRWRRRAVETTSAKALFKRLLCCAGRL